MLIYSKKKFLASLFGFKIQAFEWTAYFEFWKIREIHYIYISFIYIDAEQFYFLCLTICYQKVVLVCNL